MRTVGELEHFTFSTFSDAASTNPADPTALTLVIHKPDGTSTTLHWPTPAEVTRDSLGVFHYDLTLALAGDYYYYWQATGAVTTSKRGSFSVRPAVDVPAAFVTPDSLAVALGVVTPTDDLTLGVWEDALASASATLRGIIGQPISASTATLDLTTDYHGEADIWLVPVTSITSVTDPEGVVVTSDNYTLKDQRLYLSRACTTYRVVLAYGYTAIPLEIMKWTKVLAAAQIQVAPTGSLGLDNVSSVAVDDGKVTYNAGPAVELPPAVAQRLKATYGGPQ